MPHKTKISLILIVSCMALLLMQNISHASPYTFTPPGQPFNLNHSYAYTWGILHSLLPGETIIGAKLTFKNINNWRVERDVIFTRLLRGAAEGITAYRDRQAGMTDFFKGRGRFLFRWSDNNQYRNGCKWVNPPENVVYDFDPSEIQSLTLAMANGNFGFGFDPDCHYDNDGIEFEFSTSAVPEPASLIIFGLGTLVFGIIKRRR